MVLGKEIDLALVCEKEGGGDTVATPGLVDVRRIPPKTDSKVQTKPKWVLVQVSHHSL